MKAILGILDLFNPASWLFKAVAALIIAGALWWAWVGFKTWVSAPMVESAIKEERAKTEPVIKKLTALVAERDATILKMNATSKLEKSKQLKAANEKTMQYNEVVRQNKELFEKFNAAMLSKSELDDRLRNITEQSGGGAAGAGDSGFNKRLSAAYAQCESDISGLLDAASRTNERAAKAEAGLKALSLGN